MMCDEDRKWLDSPLITYRRRRYLPPPPSRIVGKVELGVPLVTTPRAPTLSEIESHLPPSLQQRTPRGRDHEAAAYLSPDFKTVPGLSPTLNMQQRLHKPAAPLTHRSTSSSPRCRVLFQTSDQSGAVTNDAHRLHPNSHKLPRNAVPPLALPLSTPLPGISPYDKAALQSPRVFEKQSNNSAGPSYIAATSHTKRLRAKALASSLVLEPNGLDSLEHSAMLSRRHWSSPRIARGMARTG